MKKQKQKRKKTKAGLVTLIFLGAGVACVLIHVVHALTLDKTIEYKEITFRSLNVPAHMDGYRIAFIVDTHSLEPLRLVQVKDELNNRQIDLLVLGGDYSHGSSLLGYSMETFSQIKTTDGVFGVEGNHDRSALLYPAMEERAITPLSNSGLYLQEQFYLAGTSDLWSRNASIAQAIDESKPEDFVLLLSHNPDIAMQQSTSGVDLILSGHTHAGQMTFFGVWAPLFTFDGSITEYGQRFRSGWAQSAEGVPVYVSSGTGEYMPRVFARPQVILITLKHEVS